MAKKSPEKMSSNRSEKNIDTHGQEKTNQLKESIKSKVLRVLEVTGIGALAALGGTVLTGSALVAGVSAGVAGTLYQQKTKTKRSKS